MISNQELTITIHRGLDQIGGSITEISTATSRIFIDMGNNLPGEGEALDEKQKEGFVKGLFSNNVRPHQAVIYTHGHSDHVGMMALVPGDVAAQYCSPVTRDILETKTEILSKVEGEKAAEHAELLRVIKTSLKPLEHREPMLIGDIAVQAFYVSHSIDGAYCLVITAKGKKIFHTGDFRFGLNGYHDIRHVAKKYIGRIDVLITEGTNLATEPDTLKSENDLLPEFKEAFRSKKYTFVLTSSTDIERLAVIREAAQMAKRKFVASSLIFYKMLSYFKSRWRKRYSRVYDKLSPSAPDVKQLERMRAKGFVMPVGSSHLDRVKALAEKFDPEEIQLVYSAWPGYYTIPEQIELNSKYAEFHNAFPNVVDIHASGHADRAAIAEIISILQPKKAIIGIHKPAGASLMTLPIAEELKSKIIESKTLKL